MTGHNLCPNCGATLDPDPRIVYTFANWATSAVVLLISLMLLAIDFIIEGPYDGDVVSRFDWGHWAVLGLWIFYISVQLFRSQPEYRWLMIPFSGILFALFFIFLDATQPPNAGFINLDWSLYVVLPIMTFVVLLPVIARLAREAPTYQDQLEYLVDTLVEEEENAT